MERLYKDPRTLVRLRASILGVYVDAFAQQMSEQGYAKASCRYALHLVADLARWLNRRRMIAPQLTPKHLECYLKYRSRHGRHRSGDAAILRRLFGLLLDKGIVAQNPPIETTPAQRLAEEFRLYLERERRLAPATVFSYLVHVERFLSQCFADRSVQFDRLRAGDVVRFVQREAARLHHPQRSKLMTTHCALYCNTRAIAVLSVSICGRVFRAWRAGRWPRFLKRCHPTKCNAC